jgi:DNA-directed RNA polymerase alpha subunit
MDPKPSPTIAVSQCEQICNELLQSITKMEPEPKPKQEQEQEQEQEEPRDLFTNPLELMIMGSSQ